MRYSYPLFTFNEIQFRIHIIYIFVFITLPVLFYFFFNMITALAILNFLILLSIAIALHEFGHAYFAKKYSVYIREIILLPFSGISIRQEKPRNDLDEFKIAFIGPMLSLAFVICLAPFVFYWYGFESVLRVNIMEFSPIIKLFKINLVLAVLNLIPIYPMDAGRMLRAYLSHKFDFAKATKMVTKISLFITAVLITIGLFFNFYLIVIAVFIYLAGHSKKNADVAAEMLGAGDTKEKQRILEQFKSDRRAIIKRSDELQSKAERVLTKSSLGPIAVFFIKFQKLFEGKILKGRWNWLKIIMVSVIALLVNIKDFFHLWLRTHPVRKSVIFMLFASLCISVVWLMPSKLMVAFGLLFIFCFISGSFIIYYNTRSTVLMLFTTLACTFWLVYLAIDLFEPLVNLSYWDYLYLEGFRACMVPLTGVLFFGVLINSNEFFKKSRIYMPLPNFLIVFALYIVGTGVLFYECYLLSAYESDLDTIRFTLRYDIAYLIWFIASILIFVSIIYMIYLGSRFKFGQVTTVKLITATLVGFLLISFLTRDVVLIALARYSTPPEDVNMIVGLNVGNITRLDTDEFDPAIHIEVTWEEVYRYGPDEPDWSDTDWQLDYALQHNIDVYFQIHPLPPKWFINQYEDAIMKDQWGRRFLWVDEDPNSNKSRIWDLSFNDPDVLQGKIDFTEEAVLRYRNYTCIKFIGIQNEPTYPVDFNNLRLASYDDSTITAYQAWMRLSYDRDISDFRDVTGVDIADWDELDPPRSSTHILWDSWQTFRKSSLIWLVENLTGVVKSHTDKPVTVKIMAHFLARYSIIQSGLNTEVVERFFELSDVVSLDLYPLTNADLRNSLEYYKKLAGGKPIIVPEFNMALGTNLPGSGSYLYFNLILLNRYVDYVFIFTGGGHYLYGINIYDHTPVHLGLKLYRLHREGGSVFSLYDELLWENLMSIPNYYRIYALSSAYWGVPVIPWPILLLIIMPLPIADEKKRKSARKINYILILILMIGFGIAANV